MTTQVGGNSGRWQLRPVATRAKTVVNIELTLIKMQGYKRREKRKINNKRIVCIKILEIQLSEMQIGVRKTKYINAYMKQQVQQAKYIKASLEQCTKWK